MKKHDEIIVRNLYEKFTYDYILKFFCSEYPEQRNYCN